MFLSLAPVSIEDLLRGIIIVSATTPAWPCRATSRQRDAFAQIMNQYAQKLA